MYQNVLLHNCRIYPTAHSARPVGSLLIGDGRVRWIGEASGAEEPPADLRIDLGGRTVLPGLIDAHLHLEQFARQLQLIDCELPSKQACLKAVASAAERAEPGQWVLGHGWNQNRWEGYPTAAELDAAAPHHPTYLTAKSLHAAWANSVALRMAGVDRKTPDPPGGTIQRQANGDPTGILFEHAMRLVSQHIPTPEGDQLADMLDQAQERLISMGLTGVHDFDGPRCLAALQILRDRGRLRLRVVKNVPAEALQATAAAGLRSGFGDAWIRLGSVKAFADGALGPRTAAMLAPYQDEPDNQGILLLDGEAVSELGVQAAHAGFGLTLHAIGDRANHEVLNGLATLRQYEQSHGLPARRHRIEHLQLLHPDDLRRPADLAVIASMQPIHATSDRRMADDGWGARVRHAYAWRTQLSAGARLAFGSDAPVENPNPFLGLHAAIERRSDPADDPWIPHERLALPEALEAYTAGAAYAGGTEHEQGQLAPGFLADLIVLDRDPFQLEPPQLTELSPSGVMVGGMWVKREF